MSERLKKYSAWLSGLIIATGISVVLGWQLDVEIIKQPLPGAAAMNPVTAVAFIFSGVALLLLLQKQENIQLLRIARTLSALVLLIGVLRLLAVFNFYDAGIDRLLFSAKMIANPVAGNPNSMAPNTAFNFMLVAFSLLFLSNKKTVVTQYLSLLTAFIALLSIIGYTYGVAVFYGVPSYIPMAVHTAACFILLSTAILFVGSDKGFMKEISSPYEGGKAVRLLLPMAVFVPIVLGLLRLYGEKIGLYSTASGTALFATATIVIFVFLIWKSVASINKSEAARVNEIAERKKLEEEIKKNSLFLETVFDHIPNMIFIKEGDELRFAGVNKAGETLLGIPRQALIGKNDYDFFPKEQADFFAAKDREVLCQGGVMDIAEEIITTAHGDRWLHTKKIPVVDSNGKQLYMLGISEDITAKKTTEDKLRKATEQIFDLYNNAPCGYHSLDVNGIFVDINDTELRWLGYTRDEVIAKLRFSDIITPAGKEKFQQMFPEFKKKGFVADLEFEMIRKDGTIFPALVSATAVYDDTGNYLRSRSTVFDNTERKQAEERLNEFKHFFNNSNDFCLIANMQGYFETINPTLEKVLGYSEKELRTIPFIDLVHPDDVAAAVREYEKQKADASAVVNFSVRFLRKDGGYLWIDWNSMPNPVTGKMYAIGRDITERKKAEEEIIAAQKRFTTIFNVSPVPICISTIANGIFLYANDAYCNLFGFKPEEIAGKRSIELNIIDPKEREQIRKNITEAENGLRGIELKMRKSNGEAVDVLYSMEKVDIDDTPCMATYLIDISERKKAEAAILAAQKRFTTIFNVSPVGICITDISGTFLYANEAFCKTVMFAQDELTGKKSVDLGIVKPEQRKVQPVLETGEPIKGIEIQIRKGNGEMIDSLCSIDMIEIDGKTCFITSIVDISDRKKAEQQIKELNETLEKRVEEKTKEVIEKEGQYRFLLENMREGIQVIGHDWNYLFVNNSVVDQSKYSNEELLGHTMMEKYPGIENTELFQVLQRCMQERTPRVIENEFKFPDGSSGWFELSVQPVPEGLFILSMDITDRKKAREEIIRINSMLEKRAAELQASNTELERFAYVASHDLQEPLRMVSSFLGLLEKRMKGELDHTTRQYIYFAVDGAERMKKLIQALLEYSRVGVNKEDFTAIDPREVMAYIKRVLEEDVDKSGAVIIVNPMPVIMGNKTLISQLFLNLVNNALKYHGEKEPRIEVGNTEDIDNYIFYVKDNGIGIEPRFFDRIFIIFQRLHNKSEYSGTGIGLAICKKIVEAHKGRIWVESAAGNGSTFYFSIPKQNT